jgi:signal transduction histidine kinase
MRELKTDYIAGDRELKEAVTNIAHDLRTPLTAIYGYIDLMSKTDDPAEMKKYVAAIENRVAAITHLTEELYEFTVISSSGTREAVPTDIRRLLEDTLIASYPLFEQNGITPDVKTPDRAVYRSVDPDALSRVFTNIISNAAKYSENGFSVTMTEDCEITFSNRASGLTDIDVSKLFDRFFTVDPSRRSTGLGLSIAKALVEQMGGVIFADYSGEILSITVRFD